MGPNASSPRSVEDVQRIVCESRKVLPRGGGTKGALTSVEDAAVTIVQMGELQGVLEYDPGEYTFTALAGTRVKDVVEQLARNGQWLPFDPVLAERGSTLGGAVASGLSGPGRFRFGGVRDFLIGARFVDGEGRFLRGGGKVVKNAAGFDFPKLLVGSIGRLGILVELTFKVFPRSEAHSTLRFDFDRLDDALRALTRLTTSPLDLESLELEPPGALVVRAPGVASGQTGRRERIERFLGRAGTPVADDEVYWRRAREFEWAPEEATLLKIPLTPGRIRSVEHRLEESGASRRYSVGGNLLWLAWPPGASFQEVERLLEALGLRALVIRGQVRSPLVHVPGHAFGERVREALDPSRRFLELA